MMLVNHDDESKKIELDEIPFNVTEYLFSIFFRF